MVCRCDESVIAYLQNALKLVLKMIESSSKKQMELYKNKYISKKSEITQFLTKCHNDGPRPHCEQGPEKSSKKPRLKPV